MPETDQVLDLLGRLGSQQGSRRLDFLKEAEWQVQRDGQVQNVWDNKALDAHSRVGLREVVDILQGRDFEPCVLSQDFCKLDTSRYTRSTKAVLLPPASDPSLPHNASAVPT